MSNIQVQFWGFQGQNEGYSNCIWQTDVLSSTDLLKLIPKDHREEYKQMVPRGLGWRFDSSGSQIAVTCLQMIELAKSEADFFAGTIVFPRGTVATQHQLDQLAAYVKEAGDTLEQHRKQTRLSHMGPLEGEPHVIDPKEMLEASREFVVLPLDRSKFTLGGLVRKLAELRQPELSVFIVDQPVGELSPNDGLEVIQNAVQSLAATSSVSVKTSFDEVQSADDQRYQELLEYRAEQKRKKEEEERNRLAKQEEERKKVQKRKEERDARRARFLATFKKAAIGLGILAVVAGLGYGGYIIKDDILNVFTPQKSIKQPRALLSADIDLTTHLDSTLSKELEWSNKCVYLRQTFKFDSLYTSEKLIAENRTDFPPDVNLYVHHSDSLVHGLVVEIDALSELLGKVDTLSLSPSDLPGLPLSSLIVILKKSEVEKDEQSPLEGSDEKLSRPIEVDSSLTDSSNATTDSI